MSVEFVRPGRNAGAVMMAIGLIGIVVSILAGVFGWRLVDELSQSVETSLTISEEALAAVDDTIHVAVGAVETVSEGVATVETSLGDASGTLGEIGGLFDEVRTVASDELPRSISSVRGALPPLIRSGAALTDALNAISVFGISVGPVEPIETPLRSIDADLLELEDRLRSQADALAGVATDFDAFAQTAQELEASLAAIGADLETAVELLAAYDATAGRAEETVAATRLQVEQAASAARTLVVVLVALFGLAQVAPIYIGYLARRPIDRRPRVEDVTAGSRP